MLNQNSRPPAAEATEHCRSGCLSFDPRAWAHLLRLVHYYNYSHVTARTIGGHRTGRADGAKRIAANGERIKIGAYSHIGARCSIWAGDSAGRIILGRHALLGPEVFITASNYQTEPGTPVMDQPKVERDVVIGDDVWLGARVMVVAGVEIGDGCVVGASSVVTRSIPAGSIAVETQRALSVTGEIRRLTRRFGERSALLGASRAK